MTHDPRSSWRGAAIALLAAGACLAPSSALAQDAAKGQTIYMANCMACHGVEADGQGPAAAALSPPPVDFTKADWWQGRSDEDIKSVIRSGKPGTPMMPFAKLSDEDLADLVGFLRTKAPK